MIKEKDFDKYQDSLAGEKPEECLACGGPLMLEQVNLEDYQGGKLFMMEKIPAYVCQNCGEIWIPEKIIKEFEKMIETVKLKQAAAKKEKTASKIKPRKKTKGGKKKK